MTPVSQSVDIIATTQPQKAGAVGRGINGTMALLGNHLFLPENNAATYVDVTAPCANPTVSPNPAPCATTEVHFLNTPAPVFVAGVAADPTHGYVYISESPGTANATVYRFDDSTITTRTRVGLPASSTSRRVGCRRPDAGRHGVLLAHLHATLRTLH